MRRIRFEPSRLGISALLASVLFTASAAAAVDPYEAGYRWKRQAQWTEGTAVGSSLGNPGVDTMGNPVWGYWTTTGDGLDGFGSETPWYAAERTAMVWDSFQHGSNPVRNRWTREGGSEPAISKVLISTSRTPGYGGWLYRAMASWQNPVGDGAGIDLTGTARLVWGGPGQNMVDYGVELAIVMFDASADEYVPLLAQTLQRPDTMIGKNKWETLVPVEFLGLQMDAGDELLFTIKNEESTPAPVDAWVSFYDKLNIDLTSVSAVPEPAAWVLMLPALALFAFAVPRRGRAPAPATTAA